MSGPGHMTSIEEKKRRHSDPVPGIELSNKGEDMNTNIPLYFGIGFLGIAGMFLRHNLQKNKGGSRGTMEARVAAQGLAVIGLGGLGVAIALSRPSRAQAAYPSSQPKPVPRVAAVPKIGARRRDD